MWRTELLEYPLVEKVVFHYCEFSVIWGKLNKHFETDCIDDFFFLSPLKDMETINFYETEIFSKTDILLQFDFGN